MLRPVIGQSQTDQSAAIFGHEIDRLGCAHLRWNDEIALVLTVFCIDKNEHLAVARVFDDVFDRRQIFLVHDAQSF